VNGLRRKMNEAITKRRKPSRGLCVPATEVTARNAQSPPARTPVTLAMDLQLQNGNFE
jgi:hypothetical protein